MDSHMLESDAENSDGSWVKMWSPLMKSSYVGRMYFFGLLLYLHIWVYIWYSWHLQRKYHCCNLFMMHQPLSVPKETFIRFWNGIFGSTRKVLKICALCSTSIMMYVQFFDYIILCYPFIKCWSAWLINQ